MQLFIQWFLNSWKPATPSSCTLTNRPVDMLRAMGCDE